MGVQNNLLTNYTYIYLDNRRPGRWEYKDWVFLYEPFYVGRGIGNRISDHIKLKNLIDQNLKINIIKKILQECNESPFHFKVCENLDFDESIRIEIEMIAHFGRRDLGLGPLANMTDGGIGVKRSTVKRVNSKSLKGRFTPQSKRIEQVSLDGSVVRTWDSMGHLLTGLNLGESAEVTIRNRCKDKNNSPYLGFSWRYDGTSPYIPPAPKKRMTGISNRKPVFQYLNGKFIKEWESVRKAGQNTLTTPSSVSRCCLGETKTSGGYQWFYSYQGEVIDSFVEMQPKWKVIFKLNEALEVIEEFQNLHFAALSLGLSDGSGITSAIKTNTRCKGFRWAYHDSKELKIPPQKNKEIFQYFEGRFIKRFPSSSQAAEEIEVKRHNINACAQGALKTAGGYQWFYSYQGEEVPYSKMRRESTPVECFDPLVNLVATYESMSQAERETGIKLFKIKKSMTNEESVNGLYFRGFAQTAPIN